MIWEIRMFSNVIFHILGRKQLSNYLQEKVSILGKPSTLIKIPHILGYPFIEPITKSGEYFNNIIKEYLLTKDNRIELNNFLCLRTHDARLLLGS